MACDRDERAVRRLLADRELSGSDEALETVRQDSDFMLRLVTLDIAASEGTVDSRR